jgi:hypothetical protein
VEAIGNETTVHCVWDYLRPPFASPPHLGTHDLTPKRVALISSSGVNNDFRSWGEYDGQLQALGWTFGKFRNTELEKFFERATEYDLVLTTSLWNYGDPQDMRRYVPQWRRFLEQGGIIVLTDMAYSPMCDWLSDLREDLSVSYTDAAEIGG